jgi:hypothetical protein
LVQTNDGRKHVNNQQQAAVQEEILWVSPSRLGTWRKCPKAYEYGYLRRLTVADAAAQIDRELGSWWHAVRAADSIARALSQEEPFLYLPSSISTGGLGPELPVLRETNTRQVLDAAAAFWREMSEEDREVWVERTGKPLEAHLEEMNERWTLAWGEASKTEQVLAVEYPFEVRIGTTQYGIRGRVDEVYYDRERSLAVVRDHKSNRDIPPSEALEDMLDAQLHLYAWAVGQALVKVDSVAFDRARSKPAATPVLTKSGSLSKSVTDYDVLAYLAFTKDLVPYPGLKKDGSGAGEYDRDWDVVDRLSTPSERDKWNRRTLDPVNKRLVRGHLRELLASSIDMRAAESRYSRAEVGTRVPFEVIGNARNLSRYSCKGCDFLGLCLDELRTGMTLDPTEYGLKERA